MKKIFILSTIILVSIQLVGQVTPTTWYFGHKGGIKFNSDGSVSPQSGNLILSNFEGCTTVNDIYGNVVFYASGFKLKDGSGSLNLNLPGGSSATQSPIVVQIPGVKSVGGQTIYKFLLFLISGDEDLVPNRFYLCLITATPSGIAPTLSYNVTASDILLVNNIPMAEKLATCRDNKNGSWVVTHDFDRNNACKTFYIYHVTTDYSDVTTTLEAVNLLSSHLNTQDIGLDYSGRHENAQGQIKFNSSRNKLGLTICGAHTFEVFDFDYQTGIISESTIGSFTVTPSYGFLYGFEFSPSSNFIYTSEGQSNDQSPTFTRYIYQWDISTGILNTTPYIVASDNVGQYQYGSLQIGPNNKIYSTDSEWNLYISVINNPDMANSNCGYQKDVIPVDFGAELGLPQTCTIVDDIPLTNGCNCNTSTTVGPIIVTDKPSGKATVSLTLNSGNIVAKSVSVDLVNFQVIQSDECKKYNGMNVYNMGMFTTPTPTMNSIQGILSSWDASSTVDFSHEVTWDLSSSPIILNNQNIELNLRFPLTSNLTCCQTQYFIALRVTFVDANCHTCQEMLFAQSDIINKPHGDDGNVGNNNQTPLNKSNNNKTEPSLVNNSLSFKVYPNPNDGTFTISTMALGSNLKYQIIDEKGTLIISGIIKGDSEKISIPSLNKGSYIVKISTGTNEYTQKVIVQ